jgi:uncharacterized membrane protein YbaN (DUF454 family)
MADENDPEPTRGSRGENAAASWRRRALFAFGLLFTAVGAAGLVVPLLPGAPFLILAAACFTRSSPRFDAWLLSHPRLGPPVRRWRERGAIPLYAKWIAAVSMAFSYLLIARSEAPVAIKAALLAAFVGVLAFMVSRPNE